MRLHTMPTSYSTKSAFGSALFACALALITLALRLRALFVLLIIVIVRIIKLKFNNEAKPVICTYA